MKHCYTDMLVRADDEYRTRYQCVVCKKDQYIIKDRTQVTASSDAGSLRGSLLMKQGSPFITCGWCTQEEKLHEASKIRIFVKWEELDQSFAYSTVNHLPIPIGTRFVVKRFRPVLRTVMGCRVCFNEQDSISQKTGKPHAFGSIAAPVADAPMQGSSGVIYREKPQVEVVPSKWESDPGSGTQTWPRSTQDGDTAVLNNKIERQWSDVGRNK